MTHTRELRAGALNTTIERLRQMMRAPDAAPSALAARGVPAAESARIEPLLMVATTLSNLLALAMPLAVLQIYDRIIPRGALETLWVIALGLVAVAVFEFALKALQGRIVALSAARLGQSLQLEALRRVLWRAPEVDSKPAHEIVERYAAIDRLADYYGGPVRLSLIELPFAAVFFGVIALIGGPLALVPMVVFIGFLATIYWIGRRMKEITAERADQDRKVADFTTETLNSIATVKSFAIEALLLRRYERLLKSLAEMQRKFVALAGDNQRLSMLFGNINVIATLGAGALLVMNGQLSVGGLAAVSMLSARAIQPLLRASRAWTETQRAAIAAGDVVELFEAAPARIDMERVRRPNPAHIDASDVTLGAGEEPTIANASFVIERGGLTALVGPSGGGRSHLPRAIAGLDAPTKGRILLDGVEAARYRQTTDRGVCLVAIASQPFAGSILENLTLFGQGPSVDEARWAAELVGLETAVDRLAAGYDTQVGLTASESLSTGLTRQIVLARAIAQRPRLLILEDPLVGLDDAATLKLNAALRELRELMTVVVSTNDVALARQADQALACVDGRIEDRSPFSIGPDGGVEPAARPATEAPRKDGTSS